MAEIEILIKIKGILAILDTFLFYSINILRYLFSSLLRKDFSTFISFSEAKSSHGTDPKLDDCEGLLMRTSDFHKKASEKTIPFSPRLPETFNHRF